MSFQETMETAYKLTGLLFFAVVLLAILIG